MIIINLIYYEAIFILNASDAFRRLLEHDGLAGSQIQKRYFGQSVTPKSVGSSS